MRKIKTFLLQTSTQIALSSLVIMILIFSSVAFGIYHQLSDYIVDRSISTIDAVITQTQERLNSYLKEMDISVQQLCNDITMQEILYHSSKNSSINSQDMTALRRQVMNTLAYTDNIESVEIYSPDRMIYPFTRISLDEILSEEELTLVDQENGKMVWFSNASDSAHTIRAVKKILLPDYDFSHGGYLVLTPKTDFLNFFEQDFKELDGIFVLLTDSEGQEIYRYSNISGTDIPNSTDKNYRSVHSVSSYSKWELTFFIPNTLQSKDIPWLVKTMALAFGLGAVLFLVCCTLISHMVCAPLKDMEKAMTITGSHLQANPRHYANSDVNELNQHYNRLVKENNHLIDEVYEKEILRTKAEIEALQAQVNPHFIINALESMYWVLVQKGDMENSKVLLSLAHLFQYILKGKDWISLEEELHFIEQYLQIEKFRFGPKLAWSYDVDESLKSLRIPKLLIHPLVENSVKYAVETTTKEIHILIQVYGTPTDYHITVSDNGSGIAPEIMEKIMLSFRDENPIGSISSSYGLANLYKRIQIYFGKRSSLSIITLPAYDGTKVEMRIHT